LIAVSVGPGHAVDGYSARVEPLQREAHATLVKRDWRCLCRRSQLRTPLIALLLRLVRRWRIYRITRAGLTIPPGTHIGGWPVWGSEPYLISLGKNVIIADGVVFLTHDGGTEVFNTQEQYRDVIKYGRITIHDNTFIGYGVMIMPGVEIGPNTVVAAGSVVTRSIPPNTIAAGFPARPMMSVDEYARSSLAATPHYDKAAYWKDKKAELLRIFPPPE
jgi:carbonic anhydrase/acetyltransferase-like protein (isoleucine patch superfamily)